MKKELPINEDIVEFIPALRMILSDKNLRILSLSYNSSNSKFCNNRSNFEDVALKYIPDENTEWDGKYIFLADTSSPSKIITSFITELAAFKTKNSTFPKLIVIKDYGIVGVHDNAFSVGKLLNEVNEYFEYYNGNSEVLGKKVQKREHKNEHDELAGKKSILNQKICIVTGGAQGFGEGISRDLISDDANLVIADLNEEKGQATTSELRNLCTDNQIAFVKTDVSNPNSVKNLIFETVKNFGGIDVFISNAGILKAGGLEEMDPASFELMTKINYEGYFLCTKYASSVMKLQSKYKEEYFSDIIQINSKSGLKGSNRNFAYSGGKFGGIGLTQSFALELAPFRVKVNAICPGNFFEGPLWADPEKGLFVQYLKAGKVPGAKTIDDVKRFYEKQVPLGRGCRVEDVMKALKYIVSQEYETGQAVPVTGGQEMVS
jgi:NAD(P)-dependent dehydrogenase (short-subunit alcohol dehydrogenase family)